MTPRPDTTAPTADTLSPQTGQNSDDGLRVSPVPAVVLTAALIWLVFNAAAVTIAFIVALVVMIALHEAGHWATARWTGMKPSEFYLGFGPHIVSWRRGETRYGLKAVPAGAYVRIDGMQPDDKHADPGERHRWYINKSFPRRLLVITAGSITHMIQAAVTLVVLYSVVGISFGMPGYDDTGWTVKETIGGSVAAAAGIEPGDTITAVDGKPVGWAGMVDEFRSRPGETVTLTVTDQTRPELVVVTIPDDSRIGVAADLTGFGSQTPGPAEGVRQFVSLTGDTFAAVPRLFSYDTLTSLVDAVIDPPTGDARYETERPVSMIGVVGIVDDLAGNEWAFPMFVFAVINLFLGVFNMLPVLPLDGGHAAVAVWERVRSIGKPEPHRVNPRALLVPTYAFIVVLFGFGLAAAYVDVVGLLG